MKRAWRWLIVVGLLSMGALAGLWLSYRNRPLLQRATRLGTGTTTTYVWRTSGEVLLIEARPAGKVNGDEVQDLIVRRVDLGTRGELPMSQAGGRLPVREVPDLELMSVSPDGRWLLYATQYPSSTGNWLNKGFRVAEIGGNRTYRWAACDPYDNGPIAQARMASRQPALAGAGGRRSREGAAAQPRHGRPPRTAISPRAYRRRPARRCGRLQVLALTNPPRRGRGVPRAGMFEIGLFPSQVPGRLWSFAAPPGGIIKELALSPAGDRLAWLLSTTRYPPRILGHHALYGAGDGHWRIESGAGRHCHPPWPGPRAHLLAHGAPGSRPEGAIPLADRRPPGVAAGHDALPARILGHRAVGAHACAPDEAVQRLRAAREPP